MAPDQGRRAQNLFDRRSWLGSLFEESQRFRANAGCEIVLVLSAALCARPHPRRVGLEASESGCRRSNPYFYPGLPSSSTFDPTFVDTMFAGMASGGAKIVRIW